MTFEEYLDDLSIDWEHDAEDLSGVVDAFEDYLDKQHETVFGHAPSDVLKQIDPIQYGIALSEYADCYVACFFDRESGRYYYMNENDADQVDFLNVERTN